MHTAPGPATRVGRRTFLKTTAAAAGVATPTWLSAQNQGGRSPPTTPWLVPLALPPVLQPLPSAAALLPVPGRGSSLEGECGRSDHQAWDAFQPQDVYELEVKPGWHSFHPELPTQQIHGYGGIYPGPTIMARYGRPVLVRFHNRLPVSMQGYGSPDISVHLHNLHTPSESDGYPTDWWSAGAWGPTLTRGGAFKDHHYPMVCAGVDRFGGIGDPNEALGTMWYHDHRSEFTAGNVYRGLAGFFLGFDTLDSGNELDPNPLALRLPSGEYDVPLVIQDRQFDSGGYLRFNQMDSDGFIGDKMVVNGRIQPFFRVAPRKYRFRLLNGATSRVFDLQLRWNDRVQPVPQIAADGCLFLGPLVRPNVHLGPAERADIVVDFSRFPVGAELFLTNRLEQRDGRGPEDDFLRQPVPLLKFVVDRPLARPDLSRVPAVLRQQPSIVASEVVRTRTFVFGRSNGAWAINDRLFNNRPVATVKLGTAEIWNLVNDSGGWVHPVHIHFEQGRVLRRNGREPAPWERGRKDTHYLGPNERVQVFMRFRDYPGRYVMHCHNTIHEDHGMMARYDIEP